MKKYVFLFMILLIGLSFSISVVVVDMVEQGMSSSILMDYLHQEHPDVKVYYIVGCLTSLEGLDAAFLLSDSEKGYSHKMCGFVDEALRTYLKKGGKVYEEGLTMFTYDRLLPVDKYYNYHLGCTVEATQGIFNKNEKLDFIREFDYSGIEPNKGAVALLKAPPYGDTLTVGYQDPKYHYSTVISTLPIGLVKYDTSNDKKKVFEYLDTVWNFMFNKK